MKVKTFRNHNDFKFGTWTYETHSDGSLTRYGILKKNGNRVKQLSVYHVKAKL